VSPPAAVASAPEAEHGAASTTTDLAGAPEAAGPAAIEPEPLRTVPRPAPGQSVVELGVPAGGLTARHAEWGVDGGEVLLTGAAPFIDLSGRAGVRPDGSLDGTVAMRGVVHLLGLRVAETAWSVTGWEGAPLAVPAVSLRGTSLVVDLAPVGGEVALRAAEGLSVTRTEAGAIVALPDGALPPGLPLEPRVVELFRGLRGWDVTGLRAHPDAPVEAAPAFVSDTDLFFAPGKYGPDSPETAALLDASIRAALAGLVAPVTPTPPAPPPQPAPDAGSRPAADADLVPATVPPPVAAARSAESTEPAAPPEEPAGAVAAAGPAEEAPAAGAAAAIGEGGLPAAGTEGAEVAPAIEVELLMPAAPPEPGPAATERAGAVAGGAARAARAARDLPPAGQNVADARAAVTEPATETTARARGDLAAALGARPAPSPEIVELCQRIRVAIAEQRPVDEDELLKSDPTRAAQSAGATISGSVEGQVGEVQGGYSDINDPPAGTPALTPTPVEQPDPSSPGIGLDATSAAPDPIPPENLSLDADVAATDEQIADAEIDTAVTQEIPNPPFATVRDARGELGEMAAQTPAQLAAEQNAAIETAQAEMAALQAQATQALLASRAGTVGDVAGGQGRAVRSEEQTRDAVSQRAQAIFTNAQQQVTTMLQPLSRTAMARWTAGLTRLSQEFRDSLDRVQRWIDERHSGVGGFFVGIGDAVFGLPSWVEEAYDRAEKRFGDGVCALLLEISTDVNGVVAAARAVIAQARDDIDAVFTAMEEQFPEWAAQERARFSGMLDGLDQQVAATQAGFVRDISQAAVTAVAEAQTAVEQRRQAARGVLGRIATAIEAFVEDPIRAIIDGLLMLVNIPPAAFWALVVRIQQVIADIADDAIGFANNLIDGLKQGFQQFFDNFGIHILRGFWSWLFSGLKAPIPLPTDHSPRALFTFALQLMGITWPRVREILVRHIGEQNVEIIEAAWQLISLLVEQGPQGIVDMVKEHLSPETIVQTILEAAIEYLTETLIGQVVVRVIGMLNPAGAAAQAIKAIYDVCMWVFRNAARIFRFVEAVVNGMADVVAGNIVALANAVERALAMLIPPVIDFFAGLLSLGDLPDQVADVIVRLQADVYRVMDLVIGTLAERGRALLRAMGVGGREEEGAGKADTELGRTVRFTADGESHRLFVQTTGTDAALMLASAPLPIAAKIAEWQAKLESGDPSDEAMREEATEKIAQLSTEASAADAEADRLVTHYTRASTEAAGADRPSDAALEATEGTIAALLDRLFTIFGEGARLANLAAIRDGLPPQGTEHTATVLDSWIERFISVWEVAPIGGARVKLWDESSFTSNQFIPNEVLASRSHHVSLLPYFEQGVTRNGANTGEFRSFALERLTSPVRPAFFRSLGNRVGATMRSEAIAKLTPAGDSGLLRDVRRIAYRPSATGYGSFAPAPDAPVSTLVKAVVQIAGVRAAFRAFVERGTYAAVAYEDFRAELQRDSPTRSWVANELRSITEADHEWLPVSIGGELLDHAVMIGRDDVRRALGWISLLSTLRTPTIGVLWQILRHPVIVPGRPAPTEGPIIDPGGHVGALSIDPYKLNATGVTTGTKEFHDELRTFFRANRSLDPAAWVDALLAHLPTIMWTGSNVPIPLELRNREIGVFYAAQPGIFVPGMTVADVMEEQQRRWAQIVAAFLAAKANIR
jgi:hypothetical protein